MESEINIAVSDSELSEMVLDENEFSPEYPFHKCARYHFITKYLDKLELHFAYFSFDLQKPIDAKNREFYDCIRPTGVIFESHLLIDCVNFLIDYYNNEPS